MSVDIREYAITVQGRDLHYLRWSLARRLQHHDDNRMDVRAMAGRLRDFFRADRIIAEEDLPSGFWRVRSSNDQGEVEVLASPVDDGYVVGLAEEPDEPVEEDLASIMVDLDWPPGPRTS